MGVAELVCVIAEAGINHGGDLDRAYRLVDAARAAEADYCKFQLYDPRMAEEGTDLRKVLEQCCLSLDDMLKVREHAGELFLCTPFNAEAAEILIRDFGQDIIKIGSGNCRNDALLEAVAECEVILSTGMASLADIEYALSRITDYVTLLHCTSAYPCPSYHVNLAQMHTLRTAFECPVGYSDHTEGAVAPVAAAALGAAIIEKHLCLDDTGLCPDAAVSLGPGAFKDMVRAVLEAEDMTGSGAARARCPGIEDPVRAVVEKRTG